MNIRDLKLVGFGLLGGAVLTFGGMALADDQKPILHSAVFDFATLEAKKTDVGYYRHVTRSPVATLDELEMHITTLNPSLSSHPPHKHPNEELVIIHSGEVEAYNNGKWVRLGPGSIIFNASNEEHAIRTVSDTPATYHVINWSVPKK